MEQRDNGTPKGIIPIEGAPKPHITKNTDEQLVVEHIEPTKTTI